MQKKKRNNKRMLSSVWKTSEYEKKTIQPQIATNSVERIRFCKHGNSSFLWALLNDILSFVKIYVIYNCQSHVPLCKRMVLYYGPNIPTELLLSTSKYARALQLDRNSLYCRRHEHGCTTELHTRHYGHNEVAWTCSHDTTCALCHWSWQGSLAR
jgi:hypothetical protein